MPFAKSISRAIGRHALQKAVRHSARPGGFLKISLGFAMLRNPRVSLAPKLLALALGFVITCVLVAFELPVEMLAGIFLPALGLAGDLLLDGLELAILPVLFASVILPRIVPSA